MLQLFIMIEVKISYKPGCVLYYVMECEEGKFEGGVDNRFRLFTDPACPYKELMLRTLIFKCMDTPFKHFTTEDVWGMDLLRFGFHKETENGKEIYAAAADELKLPSDCHGQ